MELIRSFYRLFVYVRHLFISESPRLFFIMLALIRESAMCIYGNVSSLLPHFRPKWRWARKVLLRLQSARGQDTLMEKQTRQLHLQRQINSRSAAVSLEAEKPLRKMQHVLEQNINGNTGVEFYAVFDGHDGDLASSFCKHVLTRNIFVRINDILIMQQELHSNHPESSPAFSEDDLKYFNYYTQDGQIDFSKIIMDEVRYFDQKLLEFEKKNNISAGATALMAVIYQEKLLIANVGDSRAVLLTAEGSVVQVSNEHKPDFLRERQRIFDNGGFILNDGVWRLTGTLCTSRALGDLRLKEKKFLVPDPDFFRFDLHNRHIVFMVIASNAVWVRISNTDACSLVLDHLHEEDFGAKALTMEAFRRGSLDNVSVLVVLGQYGQRYCENIMKLQAS